MMNRLFVLTVAGMFCALSEVRAADDFSGGVALIVGSEGKGMSRLLREKCDAVVSLPMAGNLTSLNASVAGGIIMYEVARQRMGLSAFNGGK